MSVDDWEAKKQPGSENAVPLTTDASVPKMPAGLRMFWSSIVSVPVYLGLQATEEMLVQMSGVVHQTVLSSSTTT